jgi:hypothetical protein
MAGHSLPTPDDDEAARRIARGRWKMLLVLLVCIAPVAASYFAYFVVRPQGRTNYSDFVSPTRPIPGDLPLSDLRGGSVASASLKGQWLLVVVSGAACVARCERYLWIQRQLRESLGGERDRIDRVWLIDDTATPRAETLQAVASGGAISVLRVPFGPLSAWLRPADRRHLEDHLYVVDPQGDWMMRVPPDPDPARLKRDIEKLLRASAGWDRPGR